jgi:hypothetical protein
MKSSAPKGKDAVERGTNTKGMNLTNTTKKYELLGGAPTDMARLVTTKTRVKPTTPDRTERMKPAAPKASNVYRAKKGDGLWQVAEKTVPKGVSTAAWWTQIKKLNSTNGKVNRTYRNTGVRLPSSPTPEPKDGGWNRKEDGPSKSKP